MYFVSIIFLLLLFLTATLSLTQTNSVSATTHQLSSPIPFKDVTQSLGIFQHESEQFGGATIADIDSDGHYDLLLTYHNRHPMRLYFGTPSGKFTRSPFAVGGDVHGVAVAPRTAFSNEKVIGVSMGGGRGTMLRAPNMFLVQQNRSISTVTTMLGFGQAVSRGRVPVFMDLSIKGRQQSRNNLGGPDVLFVNFIGANGNLKHFAYGNEKGNYKLKSVPGFENQNEERAMVTDIDGDGVMELVHFSVLKFFKLTSAFKFQDVTRTVWPGWRNMKRSISAIAECDFNNDGRMDLYIARAESALVTPRGPPSVPEIRDVLLMNTGGSYVDASEKAGLMDGINSMGVSCEDVDNDGWVDVLVTTYEGEDILLLNKRDGSFQRVNPGTKKPVTTRGANIVLVDYDLDGRVDYIAGHGLRKQYFGKYVVMKNEMELGNGKRNYLLVRVGNEKSRACTSLNALVTVYLGGGRRMIRRVGGRGVGAGGLSYIDTVHFGLGGYKMVNRVGVKWSCGGVQSRTDVVANQKVEFGMFN